MIRLRQILVLALLFQLSLNPLLAASLSFSEGAATGNAVTNKVGSLFADDLLVAINGSSLTIEQSDGARKKIIASGTVFNTTQKDDKIVGFCYFNKGEKLAEILGRDAGSTDVIITKSGEQIACKIEHLAPEVVVFILDGAQKQLTIEEVRSIKSANMFEFSARAGATDAANLDQIVFSATFDRALSRKLERQTGDITHAGADDVPLTERILGFSAGVLALSVAAGVILPLAIAVPIIRNREKMRNRRDSQQAEALVRSIAQRQQLLQPRRNNNNN